VTKRASLPVLLALAVGQWLWSGCGRNGSMTSQSQGNSSHSSRAPGTHANHEDSQRLKKAMIEQSRKEALEMMRTGRGLEREKPLPNPICGPGRPVPDYANYYEVHDDYPAYLLCTFRVMSNITTQATNRRGLRPRCCRCAILVRRASGRPFNGSRSLSLTAPIARV